MLSPFCGTHIWLRTLAGVLGGFLPGRLFPLPSNDPDSLPSFLFKYLGTDIKFDGFNINTCREMISLMDASFKCHIIFTLIVIFRTPPPLPVRRRQGKEGEGNRHFLSIWQVLA